MKKATKNFIQLFLFFCLSNLIGQVELVGNLNYPVEKYKSIIKDKSKQNIYYSYTHLIAPNDNSKSKTSLLVLEIGRNFSKFVDSNTLKIDSLQERHSHLDNVGTKEINQQINIIEKIGFEKDVIKNFQKDSLIFQGDVYNVKYEYKEKSPNLNWQLQKTTKIILNYKVRKALINYGGRKWIAWYAEQIPISLGPYIFGNLPGLILELYDDKKNFHFLAVGMDNKQREIYKRTEKKIVEISKKKFFKAERNFYEKPELFISPGGYKGVKLKKTPYNPIELIGK
ncbi:MAG: GLPGLI family protein [Polaribacter sp.]